jgi:hypothetical protein
MGGSEVPLLTVKRETDIVALAAFILAIGAVIYQLSAYFRGAEVKLFPPAAKRCHRSNRPRRMRH